MRKLSAMRWWSGPMDSILIAIIEIIWCYIIAVRLRLFFAIFDFFDNFLRVEKLAQSSYTEFLISTKLQNNKSKNTLSMEKANTHFFVFKIKTVNFRLKLAALKFLLFMILILSCSFLFLNAVFLSVSTKNVWVKGSKGNTKTEK